MKVNTWITGIFLWQYETDMPNGTLLGFDADFGDMYALDGKLVPEQTYLKSIEDNEKTLHQVRKEKAAN